MPYNAGRMYFVGMRRGGSGRIAVPGDGHAPISKAVAGGFDFGGGDVLFKEGDALGG